MSKTAMIWSVRGRDHTVLGQAATEPAQERRLTGKVANRILTAYDEGHSGQLDLV